MELYTEFVRSTEECYFGIVHEGEDSWKHKGIKLVPIYVKYCIQFFCEPNFITLKYQFFNKIVYLHILDFMTNLLQKITFEK